MVRERVGCLCATKPPQGFEEFRRDFNAMFNQKPQPAAGSGCQKDPAGEQQQQQQPSGAAGTLPGGEVQEGGTVQDRVRCRRWNMWQPPQVLRPAPMRVVPPV